MQGLIGRKMGMTEVYDATGRRVPVTVIDAASCVVVQRKTRERDGYEAVQIGFGPQKAARLTKAALAHLAKAKAPALRVLREFGLEAGDDPQPGQAVGVAVLEGVSHVDVVGITKGRGFAGVVRRHRMAGGRMTHGGHSKRRVGSIGQKVSPARVLPGQRMPGHMGHVRATQRNLRVVELRGPDNLILVEGAVPGPTGGVVLVKKALMQAGKTR